MFRFPFSSVVFDRRHDDPTHDDPKDDAGPGDFGKVKVESHDSKTHFDLDFDRNHFFLRIHDARTDRSVFTETYDIGPIREATRIEDKCGRYDEPISIFQLIKSRFFVVDVDDFRFHSVFLPVQ